MLTFSRILSSTVERLLFHPVTITGVEAAGESFRLLRMQGPGFNDVKWIPGQTVQIFLGNFIKRAYTPISLDPDAGSADFLFYLHGKGPGSEWAESAKAGNVCHVIRPKDSIDFTSFTQPALFFGDETSLGAAQALHGCLGQAAAARYTFEVGSPAQAEVILPVGLHRTGQARSIQTAQKGLKQAGVSLRGSKVKAYWSAGKTGLD